MKIADKLKNALTSEEYELFQRAMKISVEMYRLLNERVNDDVRESFALLFGEASVPPEWKPLDLDNWTDRVNKLLSSE